ncbi:alpha/beta hydrolase [Amphritea sp. HPY]|uniref:alpha/beta hydrolase n=1 Tax=Amphritea sp. HPY TaxID=3421652 RepID=UPI003D7DA502
MQSVRLNSLSPTPTVLVIMFHGVGANPESMQPLAEYLKSQSQDIAASIPAGFDQSPFNPAGFQWFSINGVTDKNRQSRVDAVMQRFDQLIRDEAKRFNVALNQVILLGFSQGAIMSLEWFKQADQPIAGIVAMSGRFATLPEIQEQPDSQARPDNQALQTTQPLPVTPVCLIHGADDLVIPTLHSQQSNTALHACKHQVELHLLPGTAHQITQTGADLAFRFIVQQFH